MAQFDEAKILMALKAYQRSNPLPLDASSIWDSFEEAQTYASAANAYGGQVITAKVEGTYKAYILQPGEAGYTLEEIGVDPSSIKQYVIVGTRPGSGQQQGVIYIDSNVGYIWNGSGWVKVFEDVSTSISDFESRIGTLETDIDTKAPIANPTFTGSVKIEGNEVATQTWVNALIGQLNSGVPGIVDDSENPLPSTGYKAGQSWRVSVAGTYAGQDCEVGDLIICLKNYEADGAGNADFMVIQANIDGAVTGPDAATDGHIVVFNGATGKIIKDSNVTIASLNDVISKAHEHTNKTILDSYDKSQTELLEAAATDAQSKVTVLSETVTEKLALKADASNVYSKTDIDSKISTLTQNINTKVDSATVDSKIAAAKTEILEEAATAAGDDLDAKIGDLGESATVVEFVNKVVGSGGTDVAQQIDEALAQAKAYTDTALTITEF